MTACQNIEPALGGKPAAKGVRGQSARPKDSNPKDGYPQGPRAQNCGP